MYKYPKTLHLPWSPGISKQDKILKDTNDFINKNIVLTEKMDGENTTIDSNHYHARSLDSSDHESQHWLKNELSKIQYLIPKGYRICGENLYAKHSIFYNKLYSYFMVFSIWNGNVCLSWEHTKIMCEKLGLRTVPVRYEGKFNELELRNLNYPNSRCGLEAEGYVIRNYEEFLFEDFNKNVAKYVREGHVQTDKHWKNQKIIKNQIGG